MGVSYTELAQHAPLRRLISVPVVHKGQASRFLTTIASLAPPTYQSRVSYPYYLLGAEMTVARDVDKFWHELNQKSLLKAGPRLAKGPPDLKAEGKAAAVSCTPSDQYDQAGCVLVTLDSAMAPSSDCSQLDLDGIEQRLQRDLQALKAPAASSRCQALRHTRASFSPSCCSAQARSCCAALS